MSWITALNIRIKATIRTTYGRGGRGGYYILASLSSTRIASCYIVADNVWIKFAKHQSILGVIPYLSSYAEVIVSLSISSCFF